MTPYARVRLGLLGLCLSATPVAFANPVNVSVGVSTLGLGIQASTALIPGTLDLAVGINRFTYQRQEVYSGNNSSIPYSAGLRLQTIPVLLNYYPFHGVFRVTGGAMINSNQITIDSQGGSGSYTINGRSYPASEVGTFSSQMVWKRVAPYLGIGWGSKAARHTGFSMGFDIGVLYTGSPTVTLQASNPTHNATLAQNVAADQASINRSASSVRFWPVIGVRVGYDF